MRRVSFALGGVQAATANTSQAGSSTRTYSRWGESLRGTVLRRPVSRLRFHTVRIWNYDKRTWARCMGMSSRLRTICTLVSMRSRRHLSRSVGAARPAAMASRSAQRPPGTRHGTRSTRTRRRNRQQATGGLQHINLPAHGRHPYPCARASRPLSHTQHRLTILHHGPVHDATDTPTARRAGARPPQSAAPPSTATRRDQGMTPTRRPPIRQRPNQIDVHVRSTSPSGNGETSPSDHRGDPIGSSFKKPHQIIALRGPPIRSSSTARAHKSRAGRGCTGGSASPPPAAHAPCCSPAAGPSCRPPQPP
eukprot:2009083-Prymnesium_polylepis.1